MTITEFFISDKFKHVIIDGEIYRLQRQRGGNWIVYDTTGQDEVVREFVSLRDAIAEFSHREELEGIK